MTRKEISKYIRHLTPITGKKCELCNSRKNIQCHHLIKVENLTHIVWHNNIDTREEIKEMYNPTVDLCEECHSELHALMEENYLVPKIDYEKFDKVLCLIQDIDLTKVNEELYKDYREVVDNMTDTVVFNLLKYGDFTSEELETIQESLEQLHIDYDIEERSLEDELGNS